MKTREYFEFAVLILAFVAHGLGIFYYLHHFKGKKQPDPGRPGESKQRRQLSRNSSFLFRSEIVMIVGLGVLVNSIGLALSLQLKSVIYLDMIGTAVTALLLGPWWGAVVGLISNSFVNWLLFTGQGAPISIFPWSLVNMAGGFFWGFMAQRDSFRKYVQSAENSNLPHLYYLLQFGVCAACVMSIFGTAVQAALGGNVGLALDPDVAHGIDRLLVGAQGNLRPLFSSTFGTKVGEALALAIPTWVQNWVRYIPDKTISAAIGLAIIRYGLPLFKRELILGGSTGTRPIDNWVGPLTLAISYIPSFIIFLVVPAFRSNYFWFLWTVPLFIACYGILNLLFRGPSGSDLTQARARRLEIYDRAFSSLRKSGAARFPDGLWVGMAVASIFFVLALPALRISAADFYRVGLNFFCVIYAFVFAIRFVFIMAAQNIGSSRLDDPLYTSSDSVQPSK